MDAPALVTLLVGNADGHLDPKQMQKAFDIADVKSHTEHTPELKDYYTDVTISIENRFQHWINILPTDHKERVKIISDELEKINDLWNDMDHNFAAQLYNSWRNIAVHIANASGGVLGIGTINNQEREVLHLPTLNNPSIASQ